MFKIRYWDKQHGLPPAHVYYGRSLVPVKDMYLYWTPTGGPAEYFGENGKYNAQTTVSGRVNCPPFYVPQDNGSFILPPMDVDRMHQLALSYMMPSIKQQLSSINSVYELKDFGHLLKGVQRLVNARSVSGAIKLAIAQLKPRKGFNPLKATAKQFLNLTSSSFLQWKFAISPLISDIRSFHTALSTYKKHINALVSKTGGLQKRHFTYHFDEFPNSDETKTGGFAQPWLGQNGCVSYKCRRQISYERSTYHAEVSYNFNYTNYQRQHAATLALLDSLGIGFNPRIVWDALPFSFIIDWVLKVGDTFDMLKIDNMAPQINIHQFLWSIKRSRTINCYLSPDKYTDMESVLDLSEASLPSVREEAYGRFTNFPMVPSLIETSGLNLNEFTLGAAIVIAQKSRK